jgi:hypothetical protein
MKLTLRFDQTTSTQTKTSVFVNGALAGSLTMRCCEARWLYDIFITSLYHADFRAIGEAVPTGPHVCEVCEGTGFELPGMPAEGE